MRIGVLAIQGSFSLHLCALRQLGVDAVEVRCERDLEGLDGLILPGGESTTFNIILGENGLGERLQDLIRGGLPTWGTCAGAIMLGRSAGKLKEPHWGLMDLEVERNAYGRQVDSFSAPVNVSGWGEPFPGVFIRAPRFKVLGQEVKILAEYEGDPVMAEEGTLLATAFHPELTSDARIHRYFVDKISKGRSD